MRAYTRQTIAAIITILTVAACSDGTGPNRSGQVGIGFQLTRASAASNTTAAIPGTVSGDPAAVASSVNSRPDGLHISRGTDEIIVTRAQLVVKDVKLKRTASTCTENDNANETSASDDDKDEGCPTMRVGPFLVDVPLAFGDAARVAVAVPAGTYSSVRFTLHKVTSNSGSDATFRQTNPDFRDISVRLEGTFNGVPFIFINDVNAKLDIALPSPLVVGDEGGDVTVTIDIGSWFFRSQGGLYSPAQANISGNVQAAVQNNIRAAFRAFRDRNRDGRED